MNKTVEEHSQSFTKATTANNLNSTPKDEGFISPAQDRQVKPLLDLNSTPKEEGFISPAQHRQLTVCKMLKIWFPKLF